MSLNSDGTPIDIKPRSRDVTDGIQKAAARAMLRAVGLGDDDWVKPQIGIASAWNEITPCNMSLRRLSDHAKAGVRAELHWYATTGTNSGFCMITKSAQ